MHFKSTRTASNRLIIAALCGASLSAGAWHQGPGTRHREVHVAAAVSLTEPLQEIGAAFEKAHGVRVRLNLAASNVLARQIAAGARADVFISADAIQMTVVEAAGLARRSVDLLVNHLAVLVAADAKAALTSASDLLRPEIARIAIGDPAGVPAGVYAKQYLEGIGVWKALEPKIVPAASVRAALAALEAGNVDAAIVYRTDARVARGVRLAFPSPLVPRVIYPAALVAGAPEAERFFTYLQSPQADAVFLRHGFGVPEVRHERAARPKGEL